VLFSGWKKRRASRIATPGDDKEIAARLAYAHDALAGGRLTESERDAYEARLRGQQRPGEELIVEHSATGWVVFDGAVVEILKPPLHASTNIGLKLAALDGISNIEKVRVDESSGAFDQTGVAAPNGILWTIHARNGFDLEAGLFFTTRSRDRVGRLTAAIDAAAVEQRPAATSETPQDVDSFAARLQTLKEQSGGDRAMLAAKIREAFPAATVVDTQGGGRAVPQGEGTPSEGSAAPAGDPLDRLEKLAALHEKGAVSDAEFELSKHKLLGEL